jgi:Fe-S-cluster-containing dehydrogenase component
VRGRLPHRRHAQAASGRHRLRVTACPWGAPQWNPETGKVVKCDYCKDRVDAGLKPACATICTTHCLHFGKVEEMTQIRRERHAKVIASLENQIG